MKKLALFLLAAIALASCDNNQTGPDYPNIRFVLQRESVESFSIIKGTNTINTLEDLNPYENRFDASVNLDWKPDDIRINSAYCKKTNNELFSLKYCDLYFDGKQNIIEVLAGDKIYKDSIAAVYPDFMLQKPLYKELIPKDKDYLVKWNSFNTQDDIRIVIMPKDTVFLDSISVSVFTPSYEILTKDDGEHLIPANELSKIKKPFAEFLIIRKSSKTVFNDGKEFHISIINDITRTIMFK